jgi:hypothetical protein
MKSHIATSPILSIFVGFDSRNHGDGLAREFQRSIALVRTRETDQSLTAKRVHRFEIARQNARQLDRALGRAKLE